MEKKTTFLESTLKSGLLTGLGVVVIMLAGYMLDLTTSRWFEYLGYLALIFGIVYGTKQVRDSVNSGSISYGNAFGSGIMVSVFAGVILGAFMFVLYKFIDPSLFDKKLSLLEEAWLNSGMSEDQVEMMLEMAKKSMTPLIIMVSSIFGYAFFGGIFSLVTSAFLKRDQAINNPFAEEE